MNCEHELGEAAARFRHAVQGDDDSAVLPWARAPHCLTVLAELEAHVLNPSTKGVDAIAEILVLSLGGESRRSVRRSAVGLLRLLVASAGQRVLGAQVPRLLELLQHKDWGVRCAALEALKCVPDQLVSCSCWSLIVSQLSHPDWGLRQVAVEALALLNSDTLTAVAFRLLDQIACESDALDWEVRRGVIRLLAGLRPGSLAPLAPTIMSMRDRYPEMAHLLKPAATSRVGVDLSTPLGQAVE
uniref:HEAT repeat domain-containing protein n=1 Tax=Haptolina ericina TaxID=156174 RepID=A0A7S3B3E9_9EUKA|mmetsp:Transcript_49755/g.111857  ORF Transcript_49755/g.111857 Transcript_49755/m.111857 type:complete len:243 (+) Transcript_49755:40-768(+)